jgi:hypothetical protein
MMIPILPKRSTCGVRPAKKVLETMSRAFAGAAGDVVAAVPRKRQSRIGGLDASRNYQIECAAEIPSIAARKSHPILMMMKMAMSPLPFTETCRPGKMP